MPDQKSQLSFVMNPKGKKCVLYQEDFVTKTQDGGLKDMRRDRKTVWIYPNENDVNCCPVRLLQKYISLCPEYHRKPNFYLQSPQKPTPMQWYGEQVVGKCTIAKVVQSLMKTAGIEGFFTNHSARHTGGTCLFRAGVQRKLIKESTGHTSDTVDKYQITSDEQRELMSKVIAGRHKPQVKEIDKCETEVKPVEPIAKVCVCGNKLGEKEKIGIIEVGKVTELIDNVIKTHGKEGKNTIKITIEITKE